MKAVLNLQVCDEWAEGCRYGILCGSVGSESTLVRVQAGRETEHTTNIQNWCILTGLWAESALTRPSSAMKAQISRQNRIYSFDNTVIMIHAMGACGHPRAIESSPSWLQCATFSNQKRSRIIWLDAHQFPLSRVMGSCGCYVPGFVFSLPWLWNTEVNVKWSARGWIPVELFTQQACRSAMPSPHEPHPAFLPMWIYGWHRPRKFSGCKSEILKGKGHVCAQLAENKAILVKVRYEEQEGPLAEKVEMLQTRLFRLISLSDLLSAVL